MRNRLWTSRTRAPSTVPRPSDRRGRRLAAQDGPLVRRQLEPAQHELLHARRQAEVALQDRGEALGVLRAPRQVSDEEALGVVGHGVAIARAGRAVAGERPRRTRRSGPRRAGRAGRWAAPRPTRGRRAAPAGGGRGRGSGRRCGRRGGCSRSRACSVRCSGSGPFGPEETEEALLEPRRQPARLLLERRQRRRREGHGGLLGQAHRLVRRTQRPCPAGADRRRRPRCGAAPGRSRTTRAPRASAANSATRAAARPSVAATA